KLSLKDAGPVIAKAALERIAAYLGKTPVFGSIEEAEKYVRSISVPFGPHSEAQWRFLTETWVRKDAEGKWRPHYDPRIADEYRRTLPDKDIELWYLYDAIRCPTFVLRGAPSDLLSRETAGALGYSTGPVFDDAGKQFARFYSTWRREAGGAWRIVFDDGCNH